MNKCYPVLKPGAEAKRNPYVFSQIFLLFPGKYCASTVKLATSDSFHTLSNSLLTQSHYHICCQKVSLNNSGITRSVERHYLYYDIVVFWDVTSSSLVDQCKCSYLSDNLCGVTSPKTVMFVSISLRTSYIALLKVFMQHILHLLITFLSPIVILHLTSITIPKHYTSSTN